MKTKKVPNLDKCRLPKLSIPEFSGKATEWFGFITMYDETVHNQEINNSMKIQYLKTLIKGDAYKIIW